MELLLLLFRVFSKFKGELGDDDDDELVEESVIQGMT